MEPLTLGYIIMGLYAIISIAVGLYAKKLNRSYLWGLVAFSICLFGSIGSMFLLIPLLMVMLFIFGETNEEKSLKRFYID